jgi:small-conductance mechanosensitive channel
VFHVPSSSAGSQFNRKAALALCILLIVLAAAARTAHAQQPPGSLSASPIAPTSSVAAVASAPPKAVAIEVPPTVEKPVASDPAPAASSAKPGSPATGPRDYGLNTGLGAAPPSVVRDTPRASLQGFLDSARRRDFETAAHHIHLWGIPPSVQKKQGPELAAKLANALERAVWIDLDQVPDSVTGSDLEGANALDDLKIASVDLPRGSQAIRLSRVRDPFSGNMVWVFSANTVRSIDALDDAFGLPGYVEELPAWTRDYKVLGLLGFQWFGLLVLGLLAWIAGALVEYPVLWLVRRAIRRANPDREEHADILIRGLAHWLVALVLMLAAYPVLRMTATASLQFGRIFTMGIIFVVMVGAMRFVRLTVQAVQQHHLKDEDLTRARSVMTRLDALRRVAQVLIVIVGIALAMMQFPTARTVGLSLLGSAGIAGAILGFAAQKTFSNLFAGLLISFTQPIRIGDTVIVEKEFGQIEEIASTHVVVRIWDSRRLVVPVTYFLEKPFENWTKTSPQLWGTVFLHADYRVDVNDVRAEVDRILEGEPLFNGQAKAVLVVDVTEHTAVLRVTVSADDAGKLWDLRCKVRERLLGFLQKEPERLPRRRWEGSLGAPAASP